MKKLAICITALLLFSCSTLETYIENVDNYTQIDMTVPNNALITSEKTGIRIQPEVLDKDVRNTRLIMDEYRIVQTDQISDSFEVAIDILPAIYTRSIGGRYDFYKGKTNLYKFEIVTNTLIGSRNYAGKSSEIRKHLIRIIDDKNKVQNEIETNAPNIDIFFSAVDEDIGNLTIRQYKSRSASQPSNSRWKYHTGFIIEVDNEEYGILAFYPHPKLYKNNGFKKVINDSVEDKIILCVFMAYERLNRDREDNSAENNSRFSVNFY
jgi:hypothetical protein